MYKNIYNEIVITSTLLSSCDRFLCDQRSKEENHYIYIHFYSNEKYDLNFSW